MRSSYKVYEKEGVYFITSTIIEWLPVFTSKDYFDFLVSSLNYCAEQKELHIFSWVILENHFHLVCHAPELSKTVTPSSQVVLGTKSRRRSSASGLFVGRKRSSAYLAGVESRASWS